MSSPTPTIPASPPRLPETTYMQLVLVRSLLDRAREAFLGGGALDQMDAMLLMDLAGETLTKFACRERGIRLSNDNIHQAMEALRVAAPAIPEEIMRAASRLRTVRNTVQHDALAPAPGGVAAFLRDADGYCAAVVRRSSGSISQRSLSPNSSSIRFTARSSTMRSSDAGRETMRAPFFSRSPPSISCGFVGRRPFESPVDTTRAATTIDQGSDRSWSSEAANS